MTRRLLVVFLLALVPTAHAQLGPALGPIYPGTSLQPVNVVALGADPTGVLDSAPVFRSAIASNTRIFVPPGTYRFSSTVAAPCCAFDAPAVLVQSKSNFEIDGYAATIVIDPSIALSSAFHFDKDSHFLMRGLTIQGNRTGLTSGQENAGVALSSDVDFQMQDLRFTGFGGNGTATAGDWLVDGTFDQLQMDGVGHCFDIAYLLHTQILSVNATGADTNGNEGAGEVGQTCFSVIVDTPNAGQNNTGYPYTETDDVVVHGLQESNFTTGGLIDTGTHYLLTGNSWHDNPGLAPSTPGIGLYIDYSYPSSVGVPPSGITISDRFYNNGAAEAGYGLFMSTSQIQNSDVLSNIYVIGSQFDNNNSTGVSSSGSTGFSNLNLFGNTYSGAAQALGLSANVANAATSYQDSSGTTRFPGRILLGNNVAILSNDASGNAQPMLFGDALNETVLEALSNSSDLLIEAPNGGGNLARFWTTHLELDEPPALPRVTVESLPACGSTLVGALYGVTDATAPTYNGALTGGGSVATLAYCNGASWVAH